MKAILPWVLVLLTAGRAWGELAPDEVAVIAVATSSQSRELAEYYAKARGIPQSQIFLLEVRPGSGIAQSTWQTETRPAILAWLAEQKLETKIRCFVTSWDVPLRIGNRKDDSPVVVARKVFLARAREGLVGRVGDVLRALDSVGAEEKPADRPAPDAKISTRELGELFNSALQEGQKRVQAVESEEKRKQEAVKFEKVFVLGGGVMAVLNTVAKQGTSAKLPPEATKRLELAKTQLRQALVQLQLLSAATDTVQRDEQILKLLPQTHGLLGTIRWIDEQEKLLKKNETYASFDSELSLLFWPDYSLFRWQPNLLHYSFDNVPVKRPTLMVCRLAAPRPELVTNLIDVSIATEKTGPEGKVYLDARGSAYDPQITQPGSYGQFDQSLRDLAERLQEHTDLEVVLDDKGPLFQPGDCPDAALYCGWYRLGNYLDAFDWRPGAVGYHMASLEAAELRSRGSKTWCAAMLEDGITATLGPVNEPYLAAFPLPDDFFSMLLTGRYTLVETYYRTKPFNSWQMVLVGDPLYNPFKNRPLLDQDDLPDRMKPKIPETGAGRD